MPVISTTAAMYDLHRRFTERLTEQLRAARGLIKLEAEVDLAGKRAYLQQRIAALKATEAARQSAIARFDADIERRKRQIAAIEAGLKQGDLARKQASASGRKPKAGKTPAAKPAAEATARKRAKG